MQTEQEQSPEEQRKQRKIEDEMLAQYRIFKREGRTSHLTMLRTLGWATGEHLIGHTPKEKEKWKECLEQRFILGTAGGDPEVEQKSVTAGNSESMVFPSRIRLNDEEHYFTPLIDLPSRFPRPPVRQINPEDPKFVSYGANAANDHPERG